MKFLNAFCRMLKRSTSKKHLIKDYTKLLSKIYKYRENI